MRRRRLLCIPLFALLALLSAGLSAQNVFVLPGLSGSTPVTVFTADPFAQAGAVSTAAVNASFAFAGPGGKFYIVSNTSTNTVQVTDSTFGNVHTIADLVGALAAAMSPDGKRLVVESSGGTLNIVDTSTDTLLGTSPSAGGQVLDLAFSIDSTRLFVATSNSSGSHVVVVDPNSGLVSNTIPVTGTATAISVAPSGLVYVSSQGAVVELNPTALTARYTIAVNGRPGRLAFTPDGTFGIAANQTATTGFEAFVLNLSNHTLAASVPASSFPASVTLSDIFPVGNNRVLAFSSQAQSLFDITLNPLSVAPFALSGGGAIGSVAVTNTLPTATNPNTQFLFFASDTTLYRVDLNANQITGQQTLSGTAGAISFAAAGVTNGTPATLLTYGDNQSVAPNAATSPLVVKVVDAQGRPLAGIPVAFSTTGAGLTFSNTTAVTDNLGNASTTVTGKTSGSIPVTASAGALTATFTVNVGTSGGGGGNNSSSGLNIVGGQGEIVLSNSNTSLAQGGSPLIVQLLDPSGNPMQGQTIVFTLQSGPGTILDANGQRAGLNQALTETTSSCPAGSPASCVPGQALVNFLSSDVPTTPPDFTQASISATAPTGNTVTFYVSSVPQFQQAQIFPDNFTTGTMLTAQSGQTITAALQATVVSLTNSPIPNVSMFIQDGNDPAKPPPATCAGVFTLSGANGKLSCDLIASAAPGSYPIVVNIGYNRTYHLTLVITPGVASKASIAGGDKQSGTPGQALSPLVILVTDAAGHPMSGVPVTWTVTPSTSATLSNVGTTTDSQGHASATVTLGTATGSVQVQAVAGNLPALTFNLSTTVPISAVQLVSGGGQSAQLSTAFTSPVVVKVVDGSGAGIPGVPVTFTASNGATLSPASATTDTTGAVSTTVTAGPNTGTVTVTAQAGSSSITASLTVVPAGPADIVFFNNAGFNKTISPGAIVAIQGTNLVTNVQGISAPVNIVGPLPTTWEGITVTFNGTPAPIFSVSNVNGVQQVVVQVPYEVGTATTADVTITTTGGGTATISSVPIQPLAPGIFETTVFGQKQVVAVHPDGSYITPANPAHPGENITIFLTGLGQTTPATGTNRAGVAGQTVAAPVVAGVNNNGDPVISVEAVPGLIGVYALTLTIPSDTAPGTNVPVQVIAYDASNNPYFAQGSVLPIQ